MDISVFVIFNEDIMKNNLGKNDKVGDKNFENNYRILHEFASAIREP